MTPKLEVHPTTAIFPMMPDDELAELAADIKKYGLRYPIVTQDDMLIDGRNRLKACEMAGVKPEFMQLSEDTDPVSYILSVNITRRHLTKGRQAMIVAMVYPEGQRGGAKDRGSIASELGLSGELVRQARAVLAHSPDLAKAVVAGAERLSIAYEKAKPIEAEAKRGPSLSSRLPSHVPRASPAKPTAEREAARIIADTINLLRRMTPSERLRFKQNLFAAVSNEIAHPGDPDEIGF
jgi:hypothetical protein